MKMKKLYHKCLMAALAGIFTAGSFVPAALAAENDAAAVAETNAAVAADNNVVAANADNAAVDNANAAAAPAPAAAMPNPVVTYPDIPTLQKKLGFPVLYLPGDIYRAYDPAVVISAIGGRVSDLRFISQLDNSELMVRTALRGDSGLDDISGYYGYEWEPVRVEMTNLLTIDVCKTERDTFAARWIAGNFAFAVAMDGVDYDAFLRVARSFFNASQKFAARFHKLKTAAPEE